MKSGGSNISALVVLLLILVRVQQARAEIYTCWGGCLNQCFLLRTVKYRVGAKFPCYVKCVATCFHPSRTPPSSSPPNPPDNVPASFEMINKSLRLDKKKYSCINGCALQTCHGGSELKNCVITCIDKCRKLGLNI
ncbi:hypothetical protein CTI12_AA309300 [Artemisia annua]|uniref:Thionin-like protein 2 n=1 Tax=Artemisia annua TaxID=35608 RepID=A0A2U1N4M1_ARTAN|nr:hypothetical protein CTI12_AA309300 [Artemisia annua]